MPEIIQEIKAITEINVQILFKESNGYGSQWIWLCTGDPSCYGVGQNHTKKEAIKMAIDHLSIEHSAKLLDDSLLLNMERNNIIGSEASTWVDE